MKKNGSYSFRNDKKNIFAILGDHKKFLMPVVFALAVILTVAIALNANKRAQQKSNEQDNADSEATYEVTELIKMEENAYPEVNELIETYYKASAEGNLDIIGSIYRGLEDTEQLKVAAASEYIEDYQNIAVYTKQGPVEGSYVAYVYVEVKLYDYDKAIPGLETLYICTDDNGELYINGDIADADVIEYLRLVNVQEDVVDLNNKVATKYNEMVNSDETLAELLTKMRSDMQISVGEALASSEASNMESTEETSADAEAGDSAEENKEQDPAIQTAQTIRATDVINIRSSDSETADIIARTTRGEEFKQIEALANGWSKIEYNGGVAYVKTEFFEVVGEEVIENTSENTKDAGAANNTSATTTVSSAATGKMSVSAAVRLRKEQSTESQTLTTIYQGATVNVIEQYASGWAKVEYNKKTGYIKSEYLTK